MEWNGRDGWKGIEVDRIEWNVMGGMAQNHDDMEWEGMEWNSLRQDGME